MENEHKDKVAMATEVGRLLPETKEKVYFYSEVIEAEKTLIDEYDKRQSSIFVSKIQKAKDRVEIIRLKNGLIQKERIYKSYLERKDKYEKWLDEMAIEVENNFQDIINSAKEISTNIRLHDGIKKFESLADKNTLQDRVEFYLFLKQEILNHEKFGKKKK
jgi:energy-converting hydrogenase A subunit M